MNFCFKENRIYPYKNLYGDIHTYEKVYKLFINNEYDNVSYINIYWDNNNFRFIMIYFIILIYILNKIIKIIRYKKNKKNKKNILFIKKKYYQQIKNSNSRLMIKNF